MAVVIKTRVKWLPATHSGGGLFCPAALVLMITGCDIKRGVVTTVLIPVERITRAILLLRRQKVMLDSALATLYGVSTSALVQAVKRNRSRFPPDFAFQLTASEFKALRSQTVISNMGRGGRRTAPFAFTEQGVAMLSSVLRSVRAVQVNIEIMRAFVHLRQVLDSHAGLAKSSKRSRKSTIQNSGSCLTQFES